MSLRLSSISSLSAVAALFLAAACSSSTTSDGTGGSATSSTSGTTATTGGTTATTSSTAGTGGGSACAGFLDVTEVGGASQHFTSICAGSWGSSETTTAVGYHLAGGVAPGLDEIDMNGCAGPGDKVAGLHLTTAKVSAPGTYLDGSASYTEASGGLWTTGLDPYSVVITRLDPPGGVIEGTFAVTLTNPVDAKKSLTGSFHVCRVMDEDVP